jgi:pimeloyl-ACP methyl ester carboxylesterase
MVAPLVSGGYQVACFDAPSHGQNPGRRAHLLDFSGCLTAIQTQYAQIDTVISHSLGSMATLTAASRGLTAQHMIFITPGLDLNAIYQRFCEKLQLKQKLQDSARAIIGDEIRRITEIKNPWEFFTPDNLLGYASPAKLMIYDRDDEEIAFAQLEKVSMTHQDLETFVTEKLGA